MKVNHAGHNSANEVSNPKQGARSSGTQESKKGTARAAEKTVTPDASTEISVKSKEFSRVKGIATGTPDVRDDRVAALKRKIAEGSYQVDSDAIADRMVDEHLKMSGIG